MRSNILGVNIDDLSMSEVLSKIKVFLGDGERHYIVTPNPEFIMIALRDKRFRDLLNSADISLADGFGLVLASKLLREPVKRITGTDLAFRLLKKAGDNGWKAAFISLSEGLSAEADIKLAISRIYPKLAFAVFPAGKKGENSGMIANIKEFGPKILLVGLGQRRQEEWICDNLHEFPRSSVAIGIGGAIDFMTGKQKRAPKFMRRIGMEWLWRLIRQPKRAARIFNAVFRFTYTLLAWRIRMSYVWRKNAVGFILNEEGKVLIAEKKYLPGDWQLPQGGIDRGESAREGVIREMSEELGIDKNAFKLLNNGVNDFYRYEWPRWHRLNRGYKGQKQSLFFIRFLGGEFDLEKEGELVDYKWVGPDELVKKVYPVRREMASLALEEYLKWKNNK